MFPYPISACPSEHRNECRDLYNKYFENGYTLNVSGAIRPGMQIVFAVYVSNGVQMGKTLRHFVIGEYKVVREKHVFSENISDLLLIAASGRRCKVSISMVEKILVLAKPASVGAPVFLFGDKMPNGYRKQADVLAAKMYDSLNPSN